MSSLTRLAEKQVKNFRAQDRTSYDAFLLRLRAQGCKALGYRLTGKDVIERLCVAHLSGPLRTVVAFEGANSATILLVAPHQDDDPAIDVYAQLYAMAGLDRPPAGKRRKPSCCDSDDGLPPFIDAATIDGLERRTRRLAKDVRDPQKPSRRRGKR